MPDTAVRRRPQQRRSQERFDRVLAAAAELISDTGIESVRMSEIAERAEVPIGSVYQFFPDKLAIVRTLAEQVTDAVHLQVQESFASVADAEEFLHRADALVQGYYVQITGDPVARHVLMAMQSDKDLQQLDIDDSRRNAAVVFEAGKQFVPARERKAFATVCLLAMHLTGSAVRLAVAVGPAEGERLVDAHRALLQAQLRAAMHLA